MITPTLFSQLVPNVSSTLRTNFNLSLFLLVEGEAGATLGGAIGGGALRTEMGGPAPRAASSSLVKLPSAMGTTGGVEGDGRIEGGTSGATVISGRAP